MDNEATQFVNNGGMYGMDDSITQFAPASPMRNERGKGKKKTVSTAAAVGGGFAAGAVVGGAASAFAGNINSGEEIPDELNPMGEKITDPINDDAAIISEQSEGVQPIDVRVEQHHYVHDSNETEDMKTQSYGSSESVSTSDNEYLAVETVDESVSEIHVLDVEAVEVAPGEIVDVAVVESEGEIGVMADMTGDGYVDVMWDDMNHNQEVEPGEIFDMRGSGLTMDDVLEMDSTYSGGNFEAYNDGMDDMDFIDPAVYV